MKEIKSVEVMTNDELDEFLDNFYKEEDIIVDCCSNCGEELRKLTHANCPTFFSENFCTQECRLKWINNNFGLGAMGGFTI